MKVGRWIGVLMIAAAGLVLLLTAVLAGTHDPETMSEMVSVGGGFLVYASMGGVIVLRRNGHLTGWLLLLTGLVLTVATTIDHLPNLSPTLSAWVGSWVFTAIFALYASMALTFPSGRLPDGNSIFAHAGRAAAWVLPVLVVMAALTDTLGGPEMSTPTPNPVGFLPAWLGLPAVLAIVSILLGAAVALVVRRNRTRGVERAQLTWVVFALMMLGIAFVLTISFILVSIAVGAGDPGEEAWTVVFVMMILFPVAFGVAILRYRLYDIERLISRTVSYGLVVATLGAIFALIAIGLPQVFGLTSNEPILIAGATLAVAALFNPLRRRIQTRVDRRFNRARYDAQREVEEFAERLRDELDLDDLVDETLQVVSDTVQPATATVWIRGE